MIANIKHWDSESKEFFVMPMRLNGRGIRTCFLNPDFLDSGPSLVFSRSVFLGELLNLSVPQFLHLQDGHNNCGLL